MPDLWFSRVTFRGKERYSSQHVSIDVYMKCLRKVKVPALKVNDCYEYNQYNYLFGFLVGFSVFLSKQVPVIFFDILR